MDSILAERKIVELRQKMDALETEFKYWFEQSEERKPFRKHHTQIRAVKNQLESVQAKIKEKLDGAERNDANAVGKILAAGQSVQRMILATQRIWEYFRSKLVQRNSAILSDYLIAADEFAWACYYPIQKQVYPNPENSKRKEPPLVFFNGGLSPFSVSRDRAFQPEQVANEILAGPDLKPILDALPIPVVGVPWYQVQHLPDALVIGHEVGHIIEDDFGLTNRLKELLNEALATGVDPERHAAWQSWLGEIFADVYGCLVAGPAFVGALVDFLAIDPKPVMNETRNPPNWGDYPTNALRMLINLCTLEKLGFNAQSQELKKIWNVVYPTHQLTKYEDDIEAIVTTLLNGSYKQLGDTSLLKLIGFSSEQQSEVQDTFGQLADSYAITATDIRVLFATLRFAYEKDPKAFVTEKYPERILKRVKELSTPNTRAGELQLDDEQLQRRDKQNKAAGSELFQTLFEIVEHI